MDFKSETHVAPNGARIEVATVTHEGHEFTNLGSIVDPSSGVIVGYPHKVSDGAGIGTIGRGPQYELRTWEGKTIAPLTRVRSFRSYGIASTTLTAWRMTYEGRVYSGRNGGFFGDVGALLRMRAGRKA